jgi:hypothetical protein
VVDLQQPALQALMQAHRDITGRPAPRAPRTATTDVRFFHLYGQIPSAPATARAAPTSTASTSGCRSTAAAGDRGAGAVHGALVRAEPAGGLSAAPASGLASLKPVWPILVGAATVLSLSLGLRQSLGMFMPPLTRDTGIGRCPTSRWPSRCRTWPGACCSRWPAPGPCGWACGG